MLLLFSLWFWSRSMSLMQRKFSVLWRVEKIFCEMKYFPANGIQCCGWKIASSKYKNKYQIRNGSERKIWWSVWRVSPPVPDTPWRITEDTVVDFIPAVTISANRFIPTDRRKLVFFRVARSYPYYYWTFARKNLPISKHNQYFVNFLLSCSHFSLASLLLVRFFFSFYIERNKLVRASHNCFILKKFLNKFWKEFLCNKI